VPSLVHDDVSHRSQASGALAGSRLGKDPVIRKAVFRFRCSRSVGVRDFQRHMRRAPSVMLAMRTVLPTSPSGPVLECVPLDGSENAGVLP
jgi:hypothetical protein